MSQLSAYANLYPLMTPWLPGCDTTMLLWGLRNSSREFFRETEAFREDLTPQAIVDYQQDYTLSSEYNAAIHRICRVLVNAIEMDPALYGLHDGTLLRWHTHRLFHDLDDRLLTCATAGATLYTDWTGITDGSVTFDISSSTYEADSLSFAAVTRMDGVANVIQTGLRAAQGSNHGFVRWDAGNTRFVVYVDDGTVGYLTAGTSGTDISGGAYMNGLTGAGTLSAWMIATVVFRPDLDATDLPAWLFDRYAEGIMAGAIARLAGMKGDRFPWADEATRAMFQDQYNDFLGDAAYELRREFKDEDRGIGA